MYLHGLTEYLPERIVDNEYFSARTGRDPEWFERRTGILERRRAGPDENTNTMAIAAVERLAATHAGALSAVDFVIGCSYTPWDTIGTVAHVVQRHFALERARALYISSACSSFLNAMELAAAYFDSGRAANALIVAAEHNSLYSRDEDRQSGHLWGDGAAAVLATRAAPPGLSYNVLDVTTAGLGHVGLGPEAVLLTPRARGLTMPHGKDVFHHACYAMENSVREMLAKHGLAPHDLALLVPHQANRRILDHVVGQLQILPERLATTLERLGNTGCASVPLTLAHYAGRLTPGDLVLLVAFGGGYSSGAALLRVQ
jgi:3-oxoacyl-[acyl-carrier-protein] synthase-3